MDTAIASLICITIILVGLLTMAHSYLSSQDVILGSWRDMEERLGEIARTDLSLVRAETKSAGAIVEVTLRDDGNTKLADFEEWDVIIQYYRSTGQYVIRWLPYTQGTNPGDNQWAVAGIYLDASKGTEEVFEPGILNPGEEMIVRIKVSPVVGDNTTNLVTIATPNGINLPVVFTN